MSDAATRSIAGLRRYKTGDSVDLVICCVRPMAGAPRNCSFAEAAISAFRASRGLGAKRADGSMSAATTCNGCLKTSAHLCNLSVLKTFAAHWNEL